MLLFVPSGKSVSFVAADYRFTVNCNYTRTPLKGVIFDLYYAGELSQNKKELKMTPAFATYSILPDMSDASACRDLAIALSLYAQRDKIIPLSTVITDDSGNAAFSVEKQGVYLVSGRRYADARLIYDAEPFLIVLPFENAPNDEPVRLQCKGEGRPNVTSVCVVRTVKTWTDSGNHYLRPVSITVQLLRDGAVFDTVILSEDNNWRYSWRGLDASYSWGVVETDISGGYFVRISRNTTSFSVKNIFGGTSDPPSEDGDDPTPNRPNLPRTGQLRWPIPVFAGLGCAFYALGALFMLRRPKDEDS